MDKYINSEMNKGNYLITGSTGYIGSFLVRTMMQSEIYKQGNMKLICHCRNQNKFEMMYGNMKSNNIIQLVSDITDIEDCVINAKKNGSINNVDYIIHCASNTTSAVMVNNPVETIDGIVLGTKRILELAKREKIKSMVYVSSMEVYGNLMCSSNNRAPEDMLGELDILKPRSSYPLGKRMAECYCASYSNEYGVPVKIARLAQVFGKGIQPGENRVYAQFAQSVIEGKNIVLKTLGKSISNSVSSDEAIDAIFFLLNKGNNGQAYNVVNEENTMSIKEMAELVAHIIAKDKIKVVFDTENIANTGYAADTGLYMSGEKMRILGWEAKKSIIEMYEDVIASLNRNIE